MEIAAVSVSVGVWPSRPVAAAMKLLQASGFTRVVQPAITLESVAKFIMVGVWVLFSPSWIVATYPPVSRSTKLGHCSPQCADPAGSP